MPRQSAGLLMFRTSGIAPEVLLVHPGGPYWARKDKGAWTVPKGEPLEGEDMLEAARREFSEETGFPSQGPFQALGNIRQAGGKLVWVWCFEGDCDPAQLKSNLCDIQWPPRSNRFVQVPEVDRGAWFTFAKAHDFILASQQPLLTRLAQHIQQRSVASLR